MQTSVTFKNIESSENLKTYVENELDKLDIFLDNPAEANVVLSSEKFRDIAEIGISGGGLNFNSKEETSDMLTAIDRAVGRVKKQIQKNKSKNRDYRSKPKGFSDISPDEVVQKRSGSSDETTTQTPQVHVMNIEYKPMDVEEAILQFGMMSDDFLVFTNAKTDRVNVLYHRKDGNYGLIQPNTG